MDSKFRLIQLAQQAAVQKMIGDIFLPQPVQALFEIIERESQRVS